MSLIACRPSSNFLPPCLESLLTFIVCVQSFLCQLAYCRLTVISSTTVNVYHIPVFPECVRNQRKLILFGVLTRFFPPVLWHCWLGDRKDTLSVKKNLVFVCWWWHFHWKFASLIAPVVTTTFIILSSNKIQNGDILVPANPGPPGKWPLKWRENEYFNKIGWTTGMTSNLWKGSPLTVAKGKVLRLSLISDS